MRCGSWVPPPRRCAAWRRRRRRRGSMRCCCVALALLWPCAAPALCGAHAGRPGGGRGAAAHARGGGLRQCRAAPLPARARRARGRRRCARRWPRGTTRPGGSSACSATGRTSWQALLAAANQHPPMTLRVNRRRCTGADYVQRLAARGRAGAPARRPGLRRPGRGAGRALPGGASCPALPRARCRCRTRRRSAPRCCCWAPRRCRRVRACSTPAPRRAARRPICWSWPTWTCWRWTAMRGAWRGCATRCSACTCRPTLKAGDASQPAAWWDGRPFDAILLDAPCSASGIVRRHPDIRWLRRANRPGRPWRALQARLLDALVAAAQARRLAALRHLLDLQVRGQAADRRVFATPRRRRGGAAPGLARPSAGRARQLRRTPIAAPRCTTVSIYALIRKT